MSKDKPAVVQPTYSKVLVTLDVPEKLSQKQAAQFASASDARDMLPNTDSRVVTSTLDEQGNLTYLTGSITGSNSTVHVSYEYMVYRPYQSDETKGIGQRLGVLLRLQMDLSNVQSSLNTGNLFALAASLSSSKIQAFMKVEYHGVAGTAIPEPSMGTTDVTVDTVTAALATMATIQALLFGGYTPNKPPDANSGVTILPMLIAEERLMITTPDSSKKKRSVSVVQTRKATAAYFAPKMHPDAIISGADSITEVSPPILSIQ